MGLFELFLIALVLATDAFAVSISNGLNCKANIIDVSFKCALSFGFFQGLMPFIGYKIGAYFITYVEALDHWVVLVLLSIIGLKMIHDSHISLKTVPNRGCITQILTNKLILLQAVATSIDALAVGISFGAVYINIYIATAIICLVTFIVCFTGVLIGDRISGAFADKAEIIGGIILLLIGIKTFAEHTFFV